MPKVSWLQSIRQQLSTSRRRAPSRRHSTERLESRELLSVSTLLISNQLRIVADGDESIAVQVDPNSTGRIQVLINGTAATNIPVFNANQLRSLSISAGQGNNLIDLNGMSAADFSYVSPTGAGIQIQVDAGNGNDTLFGSQDLGDSLFGGDGDDLINVSPANGISGRQLLDGGDGNDTIQGGTGDETINGGDGFDSLSGGAGNDSISAGDGNDYVTGQDGNDEIHGNQGEDSLVGDAGNDTIFGESGNDTLVGHEGDDSILGGVGADTIFGDGGTALSQGNDTVLGGTGNDTIQGNGGADLLQGQDGDDVVGVTEAGFSVSDVTVAEGNTGDVVQATFLVSLSFELGTTSSVDVALEAISGSIGGDIQAFSQTVTFAPGMTTQAISVNIVSDDTQEQTETFRVRLSNPVGAQIADGDGVITITDDDAPPPSAYSITVQFSGGLTATQQAIFNQAAQRIQNFIIGDIPDITVPGFGLIDDVVIDASGVPIDGVSGILGQAGPTGLRPASFLPYSGIMQFDTADIASLEASGGLLDVITHEMMHVIGFGTIWSNLGLLAGAGSAAPTFLGPQATAEYNIRFNQSGTSVPVEGNSAGPGSADSHWRETIFNNELMSPFYNAGQTNPVSRVTVGHFGDLGYQVNLNGAEPYLVANSAARLVSPVNNSRAARGRIAILDREKFIGIPSDIAQVLPGRRWGAASSAATVTRPTETRTASTTAAAVTSTESRLSPTTPTTTSKTESVAAPKSRGVSAVKSSEGLANVINTITFDELPTQPVDGLTVEGATFDFSVGGAPSTDANFNSGGPGNITYLQGSILEGDAAGVLTIDFANPVSSLSFGVARSGSGTIANAAQVTLFDAQLNSLGSSFLTLNTLISFPEGQYTTTGQSISRVRIDFSVASGINAGLRFALDNLTTDDTAIGPPPASGNATIIGGNGNDTLTGGPQSDFIVGNAGDDLMVGGAGNDTLHGGAGIDTAFGGDGSDSIYGQGGRDALLGGSGNDFIDGGDSGDFLVGDDVDELLTGNDTLVGSGGDDSIFGTNGNDLLLGGAGRDSLDGGNGNDTLNGQSGSDVLEGGLGDDTIQWRGEGNDTVDVGDGQDTVAFRGTNVQDILSIGQSGSNLTVSQNGATMTIIGPDEMVGSPVESLVFDLLGGNDRFFITDIQNVGVTSVIVNGGTGNDVIDGGGSLVGSVRVILNGDDGADRITGTLGIDEIFGGNGNDTIVGGAGDDFIQGNADDDNITGDAGNDSITGDTGNDLISGGDGLDSLDGGTGNDVLNGDAGNDALSGGEDNDMLTGGLGDDLVLGELGQDSLAGNAGNDTLDGGRNNDLINGGSGNDKLRGDHGDDTITGGDGDDTIDGGDGNDAVSGGAGNDGIVAGDGDDFVTGGDGSDTIVGGDGADTLAGGGGIDTLTGDDGDDVINGNGGTDLISRGEGTNIVNDTTAVIDETFVLSIDILAKLDARN